MNHDLVPSDDRISRDALERIIHRAAELQAKQRDLGDQLSERDVLDLGKEVGIPTRHMQQALLEERARSVTAAESGFLTNLAGPQRVSAERTVPGGHAEVAEALTHWMTEVELLSVKRRYAQGTSWEPRKDWLSAVKRGLGVGGKKYALTRTREVLGRVQQLEDSWSHVTLIADVANLRAERVGGGALFFGAGGTMTAIAAVLGVATVAAVIPLVAGGVGGWAIARSNRAQIDGIQVSMEQVLDRLERKEIKLPKKSAPTGGGEFVKRLTAEIREFGKNLGE